MQLTVIDGAGSEKILAALAPEVPTDRSGVIAVTGQAQNAAVANPLRSGFMIQNLGVNMMRINELGEDASDVVSAGSGSLGLAPGQTLSTLNGWVLSTNRISVSGTEGDAFIAREW